MLTSRILGTGRALPTRVLTNSELERTIDTSDAWIRERTGIRERRILEPEATTSDLAAEAGRNACEAAGIHPSELDCIIVGTVTPDAPLPSTAVLVQQKLGAGPCPAFDLSAACAGFLYGLAVGDGLLCTRRFSRVLVIGVEVLSRVLDWTDRNTCVLFGDGAGAVVLGPALQSASAPRGLIAINLNADAAGAADLSIPGGGSRHPTSLATVASGMHSVKMNGKAVFANAVRSLTESCQETLSMNGLCAADVDLVVAHQANIRIIQAVAQRCALPLDRFHLNIDRYGNTSSASVPIALDEAVRGGKVQPGSILLLCAFGAGYTCGSALVRW